MDVGRLRQGLDRLKKEVQHWELFSDSDFIALWKPPGILARSSRKKLAVEDALDVWKTRETLPEILISVDGNLGGILLLNRQPSIRSLVLDKLKDHTFYSQTFRGVLQGRPARNSGLLSIPLKAPKPPGPAKMCRLEDGGQLAVSSWKLLQTSLDLANPLSLVEFGVSHLVRHQLRAHAALGLGCPLLGDALYTRLCGYPTQDLESPLFLYNNSLKFDSFAGQPVTVRADPPHHFRQLYQKLGWDDTA